MRELILGGQKSGKSRVAEERARDWLAAAPLRRAALLATAQAFDDEMTARIERHRRDRAERVPGLATAEVPGDLAAAIRSHGGADVLLVVDCLTLWLTQRLMPMEGAAAADLPAQVDALLAAIEGAAGPLVVVSNEIAMGVMPMSAEARRFVDALGMLHQRVAAACERVTLMVAGCELAVKGRP